MSWFQAVVLGLLQGVTELFPVSSLGHSVLLPRLLGWRLDVDANAFLTFLVATHVATALVLLGFLAKDWTRIVAGLARSLGHRSSDPDARLGWLLVIGTLPAGAVGLLLERRLRELFVSPRVVAAVLILNGLLLYGAERLRRGAAPATGSGDADQRIAATLTAGQAARIGLLQTLALIPGFSRTGATIAGGLLVGLAHEDALRYSFLLATPIIGAAAVLKLPHLLGAGSPVLAASAAGGVAAAVAAWLSVRFLTRHFRTKTLLPFAVYCVVAGALALVRLGA
ncbi:MAG TPA: undecaprenyl-diphosphate phosphatase [Gemmatimonadales bacterium]|nr:undecaprenyl-diphosphate phosphatase [Gemmatimonadales bacterium]